jgi:hypothetical protein
MVNIPGTFVNPQPKYLELSKWLKQFATAPKQNIHLHLNRYQIQMVSNSVQTTFCWDLTMLCNNWDNSHILQKCTGALTNIKSEGNKENRIKKWKRPLQLIWLGLSAQCTQPSPTGQPTAAFVLLPRAVTRPCRHAGARRRATHPTAPRRR